MEFYIRNCFKVSAGSVHRFYTNCCEQKRQSHGIIKVLEGLLEPGLLYMIYPTDLNCFGSLLLSLSKCYLSRFDFFFKYWILSATDLIRFHILISGNWNHQLFLSPVLFYRNKCCNDEFKKTP